MTILLSAVIAVAVGATGELRAVRMTTLDSRSALRLLTSEAVPVPQVARQGDELVVSIPARAAEGLVLPPPQGPLESIRLVSEAERTVLRLRLASAVPFDLSFEPGMATIAFGAASTVGSPVTPELYARLFPAGLVGPAAAEPAPTAVQGRQEALVLGRLTLRPSLETSWVDATVALANPVPVRDRYLQVGPTLAARMPLLDGQLEAEYAPHLRFLSSLPELETTSHFATARLELPLGTRTWLRLSDHLARATLETNVVDPGREYFFDLAPFLANEADAALKVDLGPRLFTQLEAGLSHVRFDSGTAAGFFGYDERTLGARLGYDLGGELRTEVSYSFVRVPPPAERPLAETSAQELTARLVGPIGSTTSGTVSCGYRRQRNPQAGGRSSSYDGIVLGASLRRELAHASSLELLLNRTATLSAFETNAYYVTNSVALAFSLPVPLRTAARASLIWLQNDYPNAAEEIGAPRRDRILGWTAGLGRQLGAHTWARLDYRHERRESNLPGLDVTTHGFTVQLGTGFAQVVP